MTMSIRDAKIKKGIAATVVDNANGAAIATVQVERERDDDLGYVYTVMFTWTNYTDRRKIAGESLTKTARVPKPQKPKTADEAVREWVARRYRRRLGIGGNSDLSKMTFEDIRDVEFQVGAGWAGTDVTPGEPDFVAVRFEAFIDGEWESQAEQLADGSPADLVAACLAILAEGE